MASLCPQIFVFPKAALHRRLQMDPFTSVLSDVYVAAEKSPRIACRVAYIKINISIGAGQRFWEDILYSLFRLCY